jgi:hypothetical protein
MQSERFLRIVLALSRKDWDENRHPIIVMSAGLFIASFILGLDEQSPFAKGMLLGLVSCSGYLFGHSCFASERRLGALDMLLALPFSPFQLVLAKYFSCLSITFTVITIPSLVHHNVLVLYRSYSLALFIATIFMATTVVSDKAWAPQVPFWIMMLLLSPLRRVPLRYLTLHPDLIAAVLLVLIPPIIFISAKIFVVSHSRSSRS